MKFDGPTSQMNFLLRVSKNAGQSKFEDGGVQLWNKIEDDF